MGHDFSFPRPSATPVVSSEDQPTLILHCFSAQFKAHLVGDGTFTKVRSNTLGTVSGSIFGAVRGLLFLAMSTSYGGKGYVALCFP